MRVKPHLNTLYEAIRSRYPNSPLTLKMLTEFGLTPRQTVHYASQGYFTRLFRNAYKIPEEVISLEHACCFLQDRWIGFHVGGRTALAWHGFQPQQDTYPYTHVYGKYSNQRMPKWFTSQFSIKYWCAQMFYPENNYGITTIASIHPQLKVSCIERAVLEMVDDTFREVNYDEAKSVMELLVPLREVILGDLLFRCESQKTVQRFLKMANQLAICDMEYLSLFPQRKNRPSTKTMKHVLAESTPHERHLVNAYFFPMLMDFTQV